MTKKAHKEKHLWVSIQGAALSNANGLYRPVNFYHGRQAYILEENRVLEEREREQQEGMMDLYLYWDGAWTIATNDEELVLYKNYRDDSKPPKSGWRMMHDARRADYDPKLRIHFIDNGKEKKQRTNWYHQRLLAQVRCPKWQSRLRNTIHQYRSDATCSFQNTRQVEALFQQYYWSESAVILALAVWKAAAQKEDNTRNGERTHKCTSSPSTFWARNKAKTYYTCGIGTILARVSEFLDRPL